MKQNQSRKVLSTILCIAVISVFSLSIAYAVLSETLTISGSGTVNASNWDVNISNSTDYSNNTYGGATYTTPTINGTTINYNVGLTKPGDGVVFYFKILNSSDFPIELTSIVKSEPTCTSSTGNAADEQLICNNLEISMNYATSTNVSVGDVINTSNQVCAGGTTQSDGMSPNVRVTIKLKDSMSSVPSSKVTISNLKQDFIFSQTERKCSTYTCFTGETKVAVSNGYKSIKDIKVGDYVYSYNLDKNIKELKRVTNVLQHNENEIYTLKVNNQIINTTEEHPFYVVNKGWTTVKDLDFNTQLLSLKNGITKINNITKRNQNKIVYNIEVEDNHNYLITNDEILVHNKDYPG